MEDETKDLESILISSPTQDVQPINEIEEIVVSSIDERVKRLPDSSVKCYIYTVPKKFREGNEEAYMPQLVSIGPLHRGRTPLRSMEDVKLRYLNSFKEQTKADLLRGARYLKTHEELIRQCYQQTIALSSDKFVEMILVDAIFVLELFRKNHDPKLRSENDEIFDKQWMINGIMHDMLLLENQLPYFVLKGLYKRLTPDSGDKISFLQLCCIYFKDLLNEPQVQGNFFQRSPFPEGKVGHLVGFVTIFLHHYSKISVPVGCRRQAKLEYPRSITELQEAGVQFKTVEGTYMLRIIFDDETGTLIIPQIEVNELTETFMRNAIAFEQCHYVDKFISGYVIFMDSLINTPMDVHILVSYNIIKDRLGDIKYVSTLFNNLYKETIGESSCFCYGDICHALNEYRRDFWHQLTAKWFQWKVILKRDYFGNPWSVISVFAAVVLLVLTIMQTTCSFVAL